MFLFAVIVIVGYVVYAMSPAERVRAIEAARGMGERSWDAYCRWRQRPDAFREAIRAASLRLTLAQARCCGTLTPAPT